MSYLADSFFVSLCRFENCPDGKLFMSCAQCLQRRLSLEKEVGHASVTLLSISEVTLYEIVSNIKVMYVWMIFISFVYRYEQVRQRIKIHNCWTSGTLQRRMSADIWSTKQVSNKTFGYWIPVTTKDFSEHVYTCGKYWWTVSCLPALDLSYIREG